MIVFDEQTETFVLLQKFLIKLENRRLTENIEKKTSNRKIPKKKQENVESENRNDIYNKKENIERKMQKVYIYAKCRMEKYVKGEGESEGVRVRVENLKVPFKNNEIGAKKLLNSLGLLTGGHKKLQKNNKFH